MSLDCICRSWMNHIVRCRGYCRSILLPLPWGLKMNGFTVQRKYARSGYPSTPTCDTNPPPLSARAMFGGKLGWIHCDCELWIIMSRFFEKNCGHHHHTVLPALSKRLSQTKRRMWVSQKCGMEFLFDRFTEQILWFQERTRIPITSTIRSAAIHLLEFKRRIHGMIYHSHPYTLTTYSSLWRHSWVAWFL